MTASLDAERYGRFPKAQARTGLSKGSLYNLARKHPGLLKKFGKATIVDLLMLDTIVSELPDAELASAQEA